jgi:phosphoglycolate phosphatase
MTIFMSKKMIDTYNFKHIIWDWNGTLFDDAWLCMEITNGLLKKQGLPTMTSDDYQEVFDFPVKDYYKKIGFDYSIESYESIANEFISQYEIRKFECELQPSAEETLSCLSSIGLSQSILSVYSQTSLEKLVRHFSLDSRFVRISGLDNHYAIGKIEIAKRHLAELDFSAASMVLVGDTIHDYDVSKAINIGCILIPSGHQNKKRLESTSAPLLESLEDIRHITNGFT